MENTYVFKIINNTLYIDKYNNTNNKKDLVFSLSYLQSNYNLVIAILNLGINKNKVNSCIISIKDDLPYIIKLINEFPTIEKITFSKNFIINNELFNTLNNNINVDKVECYKLDHRIKIKNNPYSLKYYTRNKYLRNKNISKVLTVLIVISTLVFIHSVYYEFKEVKQVNDSVNEAIDIRNDYTINISANNSSNNIGISNPNNSTNYSKVFEKLSEINSDTVGWITVNNTKIDYPVVKTTNNDYYLNHDFNKKQNSKGWIFMDSRNNSTSLDDNTIIYGHNIVSSGIMYADIVKLFSKSFYDNNDNNYISFNTKNNNMKWKIFSVYKTDDNTDYLKNNFKTNEDFNTFIKSLKKQSEIEFNTNIKVDDNTKIITLSTCQSNNSRYVVHAILEQ